MPFTGSVNLKDQGVTLDTTKPLSLEKAVGRVFADIRESKGLKQIDVSVGTGYVERTVGMIERGEKSPTLRTMENFASFYAVPLETVILRAKEMRAASIEALRIGRDKAL